MSDGKGSGAGGKISESLGNAAKAATVDIAKDIFEQIMSGGGGTADDSIDQTTSSAPSQHQKMMFQAQKNARMAQIQRNISRLKKAREQARKEVQQKEQDRQQKMQEQVQVARQAQEENGFAAKTGKLLKNITNLVSRSGKGEMRGQKLTG